MTPRRQLRCIFVYRVEASWFARIPVLEGNTDAKLVSVQKQSCSLILKATQTTFIYSQYMLKSRLRSRFSRTTKQHWFKVVYCWCSNFVVDFRGRGGKGAWNMFSVSELIGLSVWRTTREDRFISVYRVAIESVVDLRGRQNNTDQNMFTVYGRILLSIFEDEERAERFIESTGRYQKFFLSFRRRWATSKSFAVVGDEQISL